MRTILWDRWSWPTGPERRSGMPTASGTTGMAIMSSGQKWKVGRLEFEAIQTPGHTPGSMSYILRDPYRACFHGLLRGRSLCRRGGRIDLMGREKAAENAGLLYDSLFGKLLAARRRSDRLSGPRIRFRLRRVDRRAPLDHHRSGEKAQLQGCRRRADGSSWQLY